MRRFVLLASVMAVVGCGDNSGNGSPDLSTGGGGDDLSVVGGDDLAGGAGNDMAGVSDAGNNTDAFMCTPGAAISCSNGMGTVCNSTGDGTTTMACVTLNAGGNISMCADGTSCQQCAGANVCGAGANSDTSYACSGGVLGTGTACKFGCDPSSGLCRDMVPSNQGGGHTAGGDTFTCTGTQDGTLAAVSASTGDTLTFDTTNKTIKVVNGVTTTDYTANSKWGTAYMPTSSGTNAIVAHIKSVSAMSGAKVVVSGANALILLVDGDVTLSGAVGTPTVVALNGHLTGNTATAGPGAPTSTLNAVGVVQAAGKGGGGAGHGTAGAAGGGDTNATTGGTAGVAYGAGGILEAGAGGGGGTLLTSAGGGALQISACGTVSIDQYVVINASGGAGAPGGGTSASNINQAQGGVGGGSGGTILLEASSFAGNTIAGKLAANGAGGGGGGDATNQGVIGNEWDPTGAVNTVATGGNFGTSNSGKGGNGGVAGTAPTVGGNVATAVTIGNGGGGGGGAVGRIFLNRSPSATAPTASAASPAAVIGCVGTSGSAVTCP